MDGPACGQVRTDLCSVVKRMGRDVYWLQAVEPPPVVGFSKEVQLSSSSFLHCFKIKASVRKKNKTKQNEGKGRHPGQLEGPPLTLSHTHLNMHFHGYTHICHLHALTIQLQLAGSVT